MLCPIEPSDNPAHNCAADMVCVPLPDVRWVVWVTGFVMLCGMALGCAALHQVKPRAAFQHAASHDPPSLPGVPLAAADFQHHQQQRTDGAGAHGLLPARTGRGHFWHAALPA